MRIWNSRTGDLVGVLENAHTDSVLSVAEQLEQHTLRVEPAHAQQVDGTDRRALTDNAGDARPRWTPDGSRVYAAGFHSGNQTTIVPETSLPDGFGPDGAPGPSTNAEGRPAPEVGTIVKWNGTHWVDALGRSRDQFVKFSLPDKDVFAINVSTLATIRDFRTVGTTLFNMVTNPVTGRQEVVLMSPERETASGKQAAAQVEKEIGPQIGKLAGALKKAASEDEKAKLTEAFKRVSAATYAARFDGFAHPLHAAFARGHRPLALAPAGGGREDDACLAHGRSTASSGVISPSSAMSTAIFSAAFAVRLPDRVCSIHSLPCCTVNSMSCMSR